MATSDLERSGQMGTQLAPAFLDQMDACRVDDVAPSAQLVTSAPGTVNAKGDCAWPSGVSCHFHLGIEFVQSGVERPRRGELHCIFPSDDPKSPRVHGAQFTCSGHAGPDHPAPEHGAGHTVHEGATCGEGLLTALTGSLQQCAAMKCCDDGTLTGTVTAREASGALDVRPDFRICGAPIELDCSALQTMTGHSANAPVYGPPVDADFALPAAH